MLIGTMNHPAREILSELQWIAQMGFDFVDLTLEPPMAVAQRVDVATVRTALKDLGLAVVGHTAYYLPLCSPFESIRRAAVDELKVCLSVFAELGVKWMNLHPDRQAPMHDRSFVIDRNLQSLRDLIGAAQDVGVGLMIENLPGGFNNAVQLSELLDPVPELGLHLDIGHANLLVDVNTSAEILARYSTRLRHVHLHDNKGGSADLHLPLGSGTVQLDHNLRLLQAGGYDGTIALEVFTADRHHLAYSREVLRRVWDECAASTNISYPARTHEKH